MKCISRYNLKFPFLSGITSTNILIIKKAKRGSNRSIACAAEANELPVTVIDKKFTPKKSIKDEAVAALHICAAEAALIVFVDPIDFSDFLIVTVERDEEYFAKNLLPNLEIFFKMQVDIVIQRELIVMPRMPE